MAAIPRLYLVVCGTTTALRFGEIVGALRPLADDIITVMTLGASRVVSPRMLALEPGHRLVESYFDEAILPRPVDGPVLIAPCSFNTLNKLAQGIADSLALSITADMIGRGLPVTVAISTNAALWAHPRSRLSVETLRAWGITVVEPVEANGERTLAPIGEISSSVAARIA